MTPIVKLRGLILWPFQQPGCGRHIQTANVEMQATVYNDYIQAAEITRIWQHILHVRYHSRS